jgi:hypothetical protein
VRRYGRLGPLALTLRSVKARPVKSMLALIAWSKIGHRTERHIATVRLAAFETRPHLATLIRRSNKRSEPTGPSRHFVVAQ